MNAPASNFNELVGAASYTLTSQEHGHDSFGYVNMHTASCVTQDCNDPPIAVNDT